MADQPTRTLSEPIEYNGDTITFVTLRSVKAKGLRKIASAKDEFEASFQMVCAVTGLTDEQADELSALDFTELAEAAADFLPARGSSESTSPSGDQSSQTSPAS